MPRSLGHPVLCHQLGQAHVQQAEGAAHALVQHQSLGAAFLSRGERQQGAHRSDTLYVQQAEGAAHALVQHQSLGAAFLSRGEERQRRVPQVNTLRENAWSLF